MNALLWAGASLLLAIACAALYLRERARLSRLVREAAAAAHESPEQALARWRGEFVRLRAEAEQARTLRQEAESHAAETEARLALALRGAQDGLWEWNLLTGEAYYSPAWKSLLGHADTEIGAGFVEWTGRIHPDERAAVERELRAHVEGASSSLEVECRLRHRDGNWRWMLTRATALRDAAGRAYRLVGLNTDVSVRRQSLELVLDTAEALSVLSGEDCCRALVRKLAQVVGAPEAFLCICADQPATRVRMLAHWIDGIHGELEEFDLAGTPCAEVIGQARTVFVPHGVASRWPAEHDEPRSEAYLGLPCIDTHGQVIGHIACKSDTGMGPDLPHQAVLKLFALRAAVELERTLRSLVPATA